MAPHRALTSSRRTGRPVRLARPAIPHITSSLVPQESDPTDNGTANLPLGAPLGIEPSPYSESSRSRDPIGHGDRKESPRRSPEGPTRLPRPSVEQFARVRRIDLEPTERPRRPGPLELVRLITVEEVVLRRALRKGVLDGEPHRDQADTVLAVRGIEPRLVEVEDGAVPEPIQGRGGPPVERQDEEPEPATRECELA